MKDIFVYGANGFGTEILAIIEDANLDKWNIKGFIDDTKEIGEMPYKQYKVFGSFDYLVETYSDKEVDVAIGIADPKSREIVVNRVKGKLKKVNFPIIIHPSSSVNETSTLSEGCIIANNCIVTNKLILEEFVMLNCSVTVGHESIIKKFSTVMSGVNIGGNTTIGEYSFIGLGANIMQKIKIGKNVTIGIGTSIIRNVEDDVTVVNNLNNIKIPKNKS